jgi:pimeloyl-ACP methyl ester carboxylesterase
LEKVAKGYSELPWGQVHFRTVNAAPALPVMLLLHQSPLSSRNYEALLPLLAGHARPYALDTPGYGASSAAPERWEVADYAAALWDCADRLGAGKVILFGRATGAVFALEAAMSYPERVKCLVLHGLPVYSAAEREDRMARFASPIPSQSDGSHLQAIWQRIRGEYPWIGPELATHLARDFLAAGADFAQAYRAIWRYDLRAQLRGGVAVPTLLIGGTRDRIAFMHERAVALLPKARAVVLDGATDFVAEQEPARFARCLIDFIESVAEAQC